MSGRCSHCGGSLYPEWDSDIRQTIVKCLACGRTPRKENSVTEANGATKSTWNPETKTLADVEAKATRPRMPEMPVGSATSVSGDALSLYTQAARRLLDADRAHKAAIDAVRQAETTLCEARQAHESARARLDALLGGIARGEAEKPAEAVEHVGTCNGCGQTTTIKRGRCAECWTRQARAGREKRDAKAAEVVAGAE